MAVRGIKVASPGEASNRAGERVRALVPPTGCPLSTPEPASTDNDPAEPVALAVGAGADQA